MEIKDLVNIGYTPEEAQKIISEGVSRKKYSKFAIIVEYNRGLGKEFFSLGETHGENLEEVRQNAEKKAEAYFRENKGEIIKVKIKPQN